MIIPGVLLPIKEAPAATPSPTTPLTVGDVLTGRVTQMGSDGRGVVRFPDGRGFAFQSGPSLQVGEPVQVQVARLVPEIAFRLLDSSSQAATTLATSAEQSLVRAPELFASLLRWAGLSPNNEALLQRSLPNISVQGLLQGEITELAQLLETGSRQDVRAMIQQVRQGAVDLLLAEGEPAADGKNPGTASDAALDGSAVRNTLHRLGDLLAMQEILPRISLAPDGGQLMGYRLFWLMEGGLGEAIWYRKRSREEQEEEEGRARPAKESTLTTVLLSLNMTHLGAVQARLSDQDGVCAIRIAAEEEESLSMLRRRISELRGALLAAALPLSGLDLARLSPGELKANRMRALGMASHFSAEV